MKIGIIVEGKNDYKALSVIIKKIVKDDALEIFGAFKDGKTGIIHRKKLLSNKLKNQGCERVIIIRDSDGSKIDKLENKIRKAYSTTQISKIYELAFAIEELESWFLSDEKSLINLYSLPNVTLSKLTSPDKIHSPKEKLKECIDKHSKGESQYLESDSLKIAELLDIDVVKSKSQSFAVFSKLITSTVSK